MARPTTSRRLLTVLAASVTAVALVAGCGGSDVREAGTSTDNTATETQPNVTDPQTGVVADPAATAAAVPGRTAGNTALTASGTGAGARSGTGAGASAGAATGAGAAGTGTGAGTKPGGTTQGAGAGAAAGAGAGSAAERLVASAPIFGGMAACKPATLSEIPIGNVSTLSGVLGELLSPVVPALQVFVASQNACGGLNGHRIKLYIDDDQGDPSTAASKVQDMIQSKKVLAFVGNIEVLTIDAVVPVIKRSGIPMIGGDLVSNTWYTNPLLFPQGSGPGGVAYGYLLGQTQYHKAKNVGDIWCIEVPRACEQINRAYNELAPQMGATVKKSVQASITQPSYVQECLSFKNAGVESLAMALDAASMNRLARSCQQVGFNPTIIATSLGVGNEKQFLTGNKWLGNSYVPMTYFPWFASDTPEQKYWQASVKKYNPGFAEGGAASTGWTAGALLVAASAELSPTNPTTADLLKVLYSFQGQTWTQLGGFTPPLTFRANGIPTVPYCMFAGISNADNTGWAKAVSTAKCTNLIAPSDPQKNS